MSNVKKLARLKRVRIKANRKKMEADLRVFNRFIKQLDALRNKVPTVPRSDSIDASLLTIRTAIVAECRAARLRGKV